MPSCVSDNFAFCCLSTMLFLPVFVNINTAKFMFANGGGGGSIIRTYILFNNDIVPIDLLTVYF